MDIAKAKEFIYNDVKSNKIYISKDFDKLLDKVPYRLTKLCFAVVDTESGPILFEMDDSYSGEPIIMRRFMHYDSFMNYYTKKKIVL